MNNQPMYRQTKSWKDIYKAVIREFPVSEFGDEIKLVAEKSADQIYAEEMFMRQGRFNVPEDYK